MMHQIVIVEDSGFMRTRLVQLLQKGGYQDVAEYSSAEDILKNPKLLADTALIIADIGLPGMNGIDMTVKLKADKKTADIPIMFISALSEPKTITEAFNAGAADFIVKPFENATVLEKVRCILGEPYEIPEAFRFNKEKYEKIVLSEFERAKRGKQPLSILKFKIDNQKIKSCILKLETLVRKIDTVGVYKDTVLVILPLTDSKGRAVVLEKLGKNIGDCGIDVRSESSVTYEAGSDMTAGALLESLSGR